MSRGKVLFALVAVLSVSWGPAAFAATTAISIASLLAGGAEWTAIGNNSSNSLGFGSQSHFSIADAKLGTQVWAYDNFHLIAVDGVAFANPDGDVDLTGNSASGFTVTTDAVMLPNLPNLPSLNVTMEYFFDPNSPTVRVIASLENPTADTITPTVRYGGNLDSDLPTAIQATASGDTILNAADRWSITDDAFLASADPANTIVYYGPGTPAVTPSSVGLFSSGSGQFDIVRADYHPTILPGETVRLMWFGQLSDTAAHAIENVAVFDDNTDVEAAGLLAGLSPGELASIVNWDLVVDTDGDGVSDEMDNCFSVANPGQTDTDGDGAGDACDDDDDGDTVSDIVDNCPLDANLDQFDTDGDGAGDACDDDVDGDGVLDAEDSCVPSPVGDVVNGDGCAVSDLCPCVHDSGDLWKNHGAYVKCVAHVTEAFVVDGLFSEVEKDAIVSDAGASECGQKQ